MINLSELSSKSWFGKLLRSPLRIVPQDAVISIVQGPLRGAKWVAGSATHGCWLGSYEARKQGVIASLVRPAMRVADIGANVGFYTLLCSRLVGEKGAVHAFEPLPRNVAFLQTHLRLNNITNVNVWPHAIGADNRTVDFAVADSPSMGHVGSGSEVSITVEMVALDKLILDRKMMAPDLIKCDIEGGEASFLEGARETLRSTRPIILIATHGKTVHYQCCTELERSGYHLSSLDSRSLDETDEILALP